MLDSFFQLWQKRSRDRGINPANRGLVRCLDSKERVRIPKWKRVLDVACIICVLPVVLPLMLLISLAIKLVSSGPVFFKQQRIGHCGRLFTCLKFRTMKVNAETASHQGYLNHLINSNAPMEKMDKGDPRVIRFGLLLRSSGLDELPQIFNVLQGEMSLVGPRPCLPYEHENYLPRHKTRCDTLPGLTGMWQVNGKNKTTFREMIAMDIWYAKNKSLSVDLGIMFRTFPAIIEQVLETRLKRTPRENLFALPKSPQPLADRSLKTN